MALTGTLRPGFLQIRVTDMAAACRHYCGILGLLETGRDADGRVYLKAWDEFDHYCVVLRAADLPGMDFLAFKMSSPVALDDACKALNSAGYEIETIPAGETLSVGPQYAFQAPSGHQFRLYAEMEAVGNGLPTTNPDVWPDGLVGMAPSHFDHCLLYGPKIPATSELFEDLLGFHWAEQVVADDGTLIAAFLTCGNKTHDIAFVNYPEPGKFHHAAFFVGDWSRIERAVDLIRKNNVIKGIGPIKHGISRGSTIYFFDPGGNRNEVFAGGYMAYPDRPRITWPEDQLGKAIFYYEGELNEAFLTVVT